MTTGIEIRTGLSLRAAANGRLVGLAAVFDKPSQDLGGFVEVIKPGAFRHALQNAEHIRALYNHNDDQILGRVGAGTLRLHETREGLAFELDLPPTTYAKDLAALVERGDVTGCSFAFRVRDGGEKWTVGEPTLRELSDLDMTEITITANPAYRDTSVALRSLENATSRSFWDVPDSNAAWLETVR